MRFRLITRPPLPPVKAWFSVADGVRRTQTISNLKRDICSRIPALEAAVLTEDDIQLSIDDFDLLDSAEVDVVREDDILCIAKSSTASSRSQGKRKAMEDEVQPHKKQKKSISRSPSVSAPAPLHKPDDVRKHISDSDTSSDDTATSSDSDSSNSDSSSSSSSESDSSSSSTSLRIPLTTSKAKSSQATEQTSKPQHVTQKGGAKSHVLRPVVPLVPPGQGKSSTHSRNTRRKLKRDAERLHAAAPTAQYTGVVASSVNTTPLGERKPAPTTSMEQLPSESSNQVNGSGVTSAYAATFVVSSSLQNKNKKNGFKRAMMNRTSQRIVFDDSSTPTPNVSSSASNISQAKPGPLPRLITPAEKQARGELPGNIFVTSVELEDTSKWDRKKKRKQRDLYGFSEQDQTQDVWEGDTMQLDYGTLEESALPESASAVQPEKGKGLSNEVNWKEIDDKWASFTVLTDANAIKSGSLIGIQELAINPATFTPEFLVSVARVISIDADGSELVIAHIPRSSSRQLAFGGADVVDDHDIDDDGLTIEEDKLEFSALLGGAWRLVSTSA